MVDYYYKKSNAVPLSRLVEQIKTSEITSGTPGLKSELLVGHTERK